MLITRSRNVATPKVVDLAAVLGVRDAHSVLARSVEIPSGVAGAQRLGRLVTGAVVVEGVVLRMVGLGRRTSAALYGQGDVLSAGEVEPLPFVVSCRALAPTRLVLLDQRATAAISAEPGVAAALAARIDRHDDELGLQSLLTQLVSIEERLGVILPRLADRWGTVTSDGVVLPAFLSHTILAALVGVRRPSLTTAIAALDSAGQLQRMDDRRWLVAPELAGLATAA